jgi:phage host-nuclease inhibitor protein Gam
MRAQSGMTSLRAILYMDEIFGFFPPVANPPSKLPLLTLLKQARAFGIGVMLASQNPVDLDYKGLANAGTWFIGRLQTERDKMRVLDGLEGAASEVGAGFDRQAMERTLSALARRVFLVNNVHADRQEIIETRWSLSYLRGPLTKGEIKKLMSSRVAAGKEIGLAGGTEASANAAATASADSVSSSTQSVDARSSAPNAVLSSGLAVKPVLPPGVPEYFLPSANKEPNYQPKIIGAGSIRFTDTKAKLDVLIDKIFTVELNDGAISLNWSDAKEQKFSVETLESVPADGAKYGPLPAVASKPPQYKVWSKDFAGWLATHQKFYLLKSPSTGEYSLPNESDKQFRIRLNETATHKRDEAVAQLRSKYTPKVNALQAKVLQAEQKVQREQDEAKERQMEAAISIGATVLGAFARSRSIGRGASSAAKEAARAVQHQQEVARSEQTLASLRQQFLQLQDDFAGEVAAVKTKYEPSTETFETITIAPKKTNISIRLLALIWQPV